MMKYYITLYLTFLALNMTHAQDFQAEITYQGIYNTKKYDDIINSSSSTRNERKEAKEALKMFKGLVEKTFILKLTNNESYFYETDKLTIDQEVQSSRNIYYKNLKEDKQVIKTSMTGKRFLITDSIPKFKWQLLPETKKIGKYTCYSAMLKLPSKKEIKKKTKNGGFERSVIDITNTYTAWYTPEIPISNGPQIYGGLPGLILEIIHFDGSIWTTTEIKINPEKTIKIKRPRGGEVVNHKEFREKVSSIYRKK